MFVIILFASGFKKTRDKKGDYIMHDIRVCDYTMGTERMIEIKISDENLSVEIGLYKHEARELLEKLNELFYSDNVGR